MGKKIILDFSEFKLTAELFDTVIADKFYENLPYEVELMEWGNEYYGTIGTDLGEDNPVSEIPAGGLAYSNRGNYLCIFYGQTPAWPVEFIGNIENEDWKILLTKKVEKVKVVMEHICRDGSLITHI